MNITSLLSKADFCATELRTFELNNNICLNYYCCKKTIHDSCEKNCDTCKKIYSRYIIIDLYDEQTKKICDKYLFSSEDAFEKFQREHLAKIFFYENNSVRYNIYLIFLYENKEFILNKDNFIQNINYARKLFLNESEFIEYFCFFNVVKKLLEENEFSNDIKIYQKINQIVTELDKKQMKGILMPKSESNLYLHALFDYYSDYNKPFDKVLKLNGNATDFVRTNFYKNEEKSKELPQRVENIKSVKINHFRNGCLPDNTIINCAKVNVLFGSNATGKSSILDAIEYGFTGETHRYRNDISLKNSTVEILTLDSKTYTNPSNNQKNKLKRQWYPFCIGTLNELFCRINYFDTDATYRFALEQGNDGEAFVHIKKLLCNYKLLDIENCLLEYIKSADFLMSILEDSVKEDLVKQPKKNFFSFLFKKNNAELRKSEEIDLNKLIEFKSICEKTLEKITSLINHQISSNIKIINIIFRRLFSYQYEVVWIDNNIQLKTICSQQTFSINAMSTAQKVCLALSVIFTQFLSAENCPQFILLDESVANLDSLHLLNLLDFLRKLANNGVQIFFTTANDDVAKIASCKFNFLKSSFNLYHIFKTKDNLTEIKLITE